MIEPCGNPHCQSLRADFLRVTQEHAERDRMHRAIRTKMLLDYATTIKNQEKGIRRLRKRAIGYADMRAEVRRLENLICAFSCANPDDSSCLRECGNGWNLLHAEARAIKARRNSR